MLTDYSRCSCGAITVFTTSGNSYSCDETRRNEFLPNLDLRRLHKLQDSYCCDHCVNRWGLDLCACGSGERYDECPNGLPECGKPAQVLFGRTHVVASDWLAQYISNVA